MATFGKQSQVDEAFQRLLTCLEEIRTQLDNKQDDFMFLSSYFSSQDFQALFKVHTAVTNSESQRIEPVDRSASELVKEINDNLDELSNGDDNVDELKQLLASPHLQGLFLAHDRVAANDIPSKEPEDVPYCPPMPLEQMNGMATPVKYITLIKSGNDALGATVLSDPDTGNIIVARILHGGVVDRSGTLQVGDVIQEINGTSVHGKTTDEVVDIMERLLGSVMFKVIPAMQDKKLPNESKTRLRALFNYDPMADDLIPCKEAGKAFKKGDIVHVVSRDDPNWWQAREEGVVGASIGLIPSKQFQQKRVLFDKLMISEKENNNKKDGLRSIMQFKKRIRKPATITTDANKNQLEMGGENVLTYEEVALYSSNYNKQRPILLIGPRGVGRNELKKRLLASDNERFATAVPHTSRRMRPYETDGREYNFVSRTTMENFDQSNKFIEYGEYRKCLYGISTDSIKRVLKTGKICIMKIQPQAIKTLRLKEYKPFIVYIKPPSLEKLRATRLTIKSKADKKQGQRAFKDDELQDMIKAGEAIEKKYGHYIDETVINDDLQVAYFELNNAIERVTRESLWVPTVWL